MAETIQAGRERTERENALRGRLQGDLFTLALAGAAGSQVKVAITHVLETVDAMLDERERHALSVRRDGGDQA